jgi:hypothetical protein
MRKNLDMEFLMAARSWRPQTLFNGARATRSSRQEYKRKFTKMHG